ncbi:hypothetical protein [Capnocytophaga sp. oral taxon 864]|uniref:hypothetical protein n=1 Tax=Capnocytophaga sp. oral taxon 864 TaxID=1316593 RepID=UPI000D0405AA|nr:hypothetical protein [Capnocytophaga sp. oral taxon 864]AVM54203.1 hypothetical protein C3V44_00315 [Capnocytophaga sp. oral taxon 864]
MQTEEKELYRFVEAGDWANSLSDSEMEKLLVETDFSREQTDEGRDYCYFLHKYSKIDDNSTSDYTLMAYTLTQPENLERASMYDMILEENEYFSIHRISVYRNGQLIDKTADTTIKVLDNEGQSGRGIISSSKKLNFSIKDLHLDDILILEDTKEKVFTEKEFLRRDFMKYVYVTPDTYWAYGKYHFKLINNRDKRVAYKDVFFRDEQGNVIPSQVKYLAQGEAFEIVQENYINPVDPNREIFPFIDFATDSTWKELSNYIYPLYEEVFKAQPADFAPDLVEKLNGMATLDEKLQYAIEFVQNNIYYVYNADEMNGHKPQAPALTYQNKQGDCKAKCVLLKSILNYLGVEASVILVNYNSDYYLQFYLPSLLSFNHVVVKINYEGKEYFVDATARNEFGKLEKRAVISFCHFMEILPNQELQVRKPTYFDNFCIDEHITLEAKGNTGKIQLLTTYRYNRANSMRAYFKSSNKNERLDSWNNSLFYALNYVNDRKGKDFREIFKDATLQIVKDDKVENEFVVKYEATIEQPYFIDNEGRRFLMYYDGSVLKNSIREHQHSDASFWHNFDSERYEIELKTDENIDTKEKYTVQECDIKNEYFTHKTQKFITKNSGKVIVEYNPLTNIELPLDKLEPIREDYHTMADSNFGIGIDVVEKGFLNSLKRLFK